MFTLVMECFTIMQLATLVAIGIIDAIVISLSSSGDLLRNY